jgi:hypothetical protein
VNETAGGFDVWVDTAQAGTLRGSINLKGPTGEAVVAIDVDVFPPPRETPPPPIGEPADGRMPAATPPPPHLPEAPAAATPPPHPLPASPAAQPVSPPQPTNAAPRGTTEPPGPVPGASSVPEVSSPRRTQRGKGAGVRRVLWALIPVLSFGFLTPFPFVYAAVRLHDRKLRVIASAYAIAWVTTLTVWAAVLAASNNGAFSSLVFCLGVVATVHAFLLRRRVFAPLSPPAGP